MSANSENFDHLDRTAATIAKLSLRTRYGVYGVILIAVVLSWAVLAVLNIETAAFLPPSANGPGGFLFSWAPDLPLPAWLARFASVCLSPVPGAGAPGPVFGAYWAMWMLMSVAMMLPSATPMIRTYCEIADTAAAQGKYSVHPLVLVGGYLAAWAIASAAFAMITLIILQAGGNSTTLTPLSGLSGAAALAIAGIYQFSGLKDACLEKCRNPFTVLFSRWSAKRVAILRLGFEQGLWCIGCCWALMLVMFAVGIMNLFWMTLLGLLTIVEKQVGGHATSRISGAILLVWAALLLVVSA